MHTIPIGDVVVTSLDDGTWRFPAHRFFANAPQVEWRNAIAEIDAEGKIAVGHNHGLLRAGDELIVVDTGYGDETHGGCTGHLLEDFARAGHRRNEVTQVVTTHAHGDHIRRHTLLVRGRREPTFARARYLVARADWEWFGVTAHVPEFDEQLAPLERWRRLELFDGERAIAPGVRLLPTPGHTPGHTSVLVESKGACAILLGDLCHHPLHFSHPQWVSDFDTHPEQTPRTRAWVFALAHERDALVLCPHAPAPGFGRIRRAGGSYVWQPIGRVDRITA